MKRTALYLPLALILFMFYASFAYAAEPKVEIIGSDDLVTLKPVIKQSIIARCISQGVSLEDYPELTVTIFQLGEVISFDAVLNSHPPRAFHSDIKELSAISNTIDEMISTVFIASPVIKQSRQPVKIKPGDTRQTRQDIDLPFIAKSLIVHDDSIYVSDDKTIYIIKEKQAEQWWNTPKKEKIFRIYAYQDSIVALVRRTNDLNTYLINKDKTVKHWTKPVIPIGGSLAYAQISSDANIPDGINMWTDPTFMDGKRIVVPSGTDFLSITMGEVTPAKQNHETLSYDKKGRLTISSANRILWSSSTKMSPLPVFIEQEINSQDPPARYYMMPRILVNNGEIITINNDRGMSKIFGNLIMFKGFEILGYSLDGSRFEERALAQMGKYYCADIALDDRSLLALIITKDNSFVQFIDL